jgi:hypothetical protein
MAGSLRRSIKPYKKALMRSLGRQGEELTVVSFPKSGRTWLQVMLGEYITRYYGLDVKNVITLKQYTKHIEGIPRIRLQLVTCSTAEAWYSRRPVPVCFRPGHRVRPAVHR